MSTASAGRPVASAMMSGVDPDLPLVDVERFVQLAIGLEVHDDPLAAFLEREVDGPFEQCAVGGHRGNGGLAADRARGARAAEDLVAQHAGDDRRRGADLTFGRAEHPPLHHRHLAHLLPSRVERDERQRGVHERAEAGAGRSVGVARKVNDRNAGCGLPATGFRPARCLASIGIGPDHAAGVQGEVGHGADAQGGLSAGRDRVVARGPPVEVRLQVLRHDVGRGVLADELLLPEPVAALAVEVEDARVPPDDGVRGVGCGLRASGVRLRTCRTVPCLKPGAWSLKPVKAGRDGARGERLAIRTVEHGVLAERRAARRRRGVAAGIGGGIEGRVERCHPALGRIGIVAHGGNDEQVARARGGHVGQAHAFGLIAPDLEVLVREQIEWRPSGDSERAQPALPVDVPPSRRSRDLRRNVGKDDDRELEALGLVHGHQTDAVAALLEDRRLGRLALIGFILQHVHEATERNTARPLVLPRKLRDLQDVGERLLAGWPKHEAGVRARLGQQPADRLGHGDVVAPRVQLTQEPKGGDDRGKAVGGFAALTGLVARYSVLASSHVRSRFVPSTESRVPSPGNLLRDAVRMQSSDAIPVLEQQLVGHGEERAADRSEHRQLVVWPLDGGERGAHRLDLLACVEALAADEQVRHPARLERADVVARDVAPPAVEAPEQDADMAGGDRDAIAGGVGPADRRRGFGGRPELRAKAVVGPRMRFSAAVLGLTLGDGPPALPDEPLDEGADGIGQRPVDGCGGQAADAVGARHGQHDGRGLALGVVAERRQRHVVGLQRLAVAGHHRGEGGVDDGLDRRRRAEAGRELQACRATAGELLAHLPVHGDVGAPEAVDRLLGVAHDEELPRHGLHLAPVASGGIGGGEQQQDLGLEGIGVLELVHEDVGEPPLEVGPRLVVVAHEVARAHQQIHEVEPSLLVLERAIPLDRPHQLDLEQGGEIRVHQVLEALEDLDEVGVGLQHVGARDAGRVLRAVPFAHVVLELPVGGEIDQRGLEAVVVAVPRPLGAARVLAQPPRGPRVEVQAVLLPVRRLLGEVGVVVHVAEHLVDERGAVEGLTRPRRRKVAPVAQRPAGLAQPPGRTIRPLVVREARETRSPAERPPHTLRRVLELLLEPAVEGPRVKPLGLGLGQHLEPGIDARLDRPLAQELGTETVNGGDVGLLEVSQRVFQVTPALGGRCRRWALGAPSARELLARSLEAGAETQLELAGGLLGERHRDDAIDRRVALGEDVDDPLNELGRLPGTRRRFDDQRLVEGVANPFAGFAVEEAAEIGITLHSSPRIPPRSRSARRRRPSLRLVAPAASHKPATAAS